MRVVKEIIDSEIQYLTVHEKRERILAYIRGKGVAHKDAGQFLSNEAIREGYASSLADIEDARKERKAWIIYMDRYIKWINNAYKAGWVKKSPPAKVKKSEAGSVAIPKVLSEKRAEKLIDNPENRKIIEEKLIEEGCIVINNETISERLVERLLEKEENERTIIKALHSLGYKVTKPARKAA